MTPAMVSLFSLIELLDDLYLFGGQVAKVCKRAFAPCMNYQYVLASLWRLSIVFTVQLASLWRLCGVFGVFVAP